MTDQADLKELRKLCDTYRDEKDPTFNMDDAIIARFYRAFLTVELSFRRLRRYHQWRLEFDVDNINENDPGVRQFLSRESVFILDARDAEDRPIVYVRAKNHNANHGDMESLNRCMVYILERALERCTESQAQLCIAFDMTGFGLANMDYQFIKQLIHIFIVYYPERLGSCLVLYAPYIFQGCWYIIRPWIPPLTASKVIFVNSRPKLAVHLDPDCLPYD